MIFFDTLPNHSTTGSQPDPPPIYRIQRSVMSIRLNSGILIACLAVLPACSKKVEKPRPRPPALVMVAPAVQQDVPVQLKAIGTVEASEGVVIKTQISGELTKVAFREGQDVQK